MLAKFPPSSVRRTVATVLEIPKPPEIFSGNIIVIVNYISTQFFTVGRSRQQCVLTLSSVLAAFEPIPTL